MLLLEPLNSFDNIVPDLDSTFSNLIVFYRADSQKIFLEK